MSMKIEQTTIFANLKQSLYTDAGFDVSEGDLHIVYDTIFGGMTVFLSKVKNRDGAMGIAFRDEKGIFKFGGKVYYEPSTEQDMPGNWVYVMSFSESDIKEGTHKVYDYTDMPAQTSIAVYCENEFRVRLSSSYILTQMIPIALTTLLNWMDENAKDKEVELEVGDYATIVIAIEKGKKVFSATPSAKMKQLIKDDDQLEQAEKEAKVARSIIQPIIHEAGATINPFQHI